MNFQYIPTLDPVKVIIVNPLAPAAKLIAIKILSGTVFGSNQVIDLILVVYSNEIPLAEALKLELDSCALSCTNFIKVSSDLPGVSDADVFCFITNFTNPNYVDLQKIGNDEQFDTLYLIIKIANHLFVPLPVDEKPDDKLVLNIRRKKKPEKKPRKPIFIADGLVAIDILQKFSKNLPPDVFFCPTGIESVAKTVLAEFLKVGCYEINQVSVWAANDETFHVDFDQPLIVRDNPELASHCVWDMVGKKMLETFEYDHTQFSASWLKKEFIEKTVYVSSKNPHGCIYKATEFARTLRAIWATRSSDVGKKEKNNYNVGVISDGSLGTLKGYPYVLPLIFSGDSWTVNRRFKDDVHLQQEIKRLNKVVKAYHSKLIPYCQKFMVRNVIRQAFIPSVTGSSSEYCETSSNAIATESQLHINDKHNTSVTVSSIES